jgi:hypothetical protein
VAGPLLIQFVVLISMPQFCGTFVTVTELCISELVFYVTIILRKHIFIITVLKYVFISVRDFDDIYISCTDIC